MKGIKKKGEMRGRWKKRKGPCGSSLEVRCGGGRNGKKIEGKDWKKKR